MSSVNHAFPFLSDAGSQSIHILDFLEHQTDDKIQIQGGFTVIYVLDKSSGFA